MLASTRPFPFFWMLPLLAVVLSTPLLTAQNSTWSNLRQLQAGQPVRVALKGARTYVGKFENADDHSFTLRSEGMSRTLSRSAIQQVAARNSGHRGRHVAIGAVIGAGAGLGLGAGIGSSSFVSRSKAIAVTTPGLAILGAAIGAALPGAKWKIVYFAQ